MSIAAQVVGLQEGPTRFACRTYQMSATWLRPQSTQKYSHSAIARPRSCPRVYQRSRVCGSASVT